MLHEGKISVACSQNPTNHFVQNQQRNKSSRDKHVCHDFVQNFGVWPASGVSDNILTIISIFISISDIMLPRNRSSIVAFVMAAICVSILVHVTQKLEVNVRFSLIIMIGILILHPLVQPCSTLIDCFIDLPLIDYEIVKKWRAKILNELVQKNFIVGQNLCRMSI